MKTRFTYKSHYIEDFATEFKIIKKIKLEKKEFDLIVNNLLNDSEIIMANKKEMIVEKNKIFHCIFVYCNEFKDGLLICSQGYDYARYCAIYPKKAII